MVNKQLLWGRSNASRIFISLLLITSTFLVSMELNHDPYLYKDMRDNDSKLAPVLTEKEKETYECHGHTWQDMIDAYTEAPQRAKNIVIELQNRHLFKNKRNARFFVGEPGTGKSATAKAIPHLAGWYFKFILSGEINSNGNRGEGAKKLRDKIAEVVATQKKVVIIIDELHRLLENYESKNYDTYETASALWEILDEQDNSENFFFIGTMNRDYKIPEPFKNRMEGKRVVFPPIDRDKRRMLFRKKLETSNMQLSKECTDDFLDKQLELLGNVSGRTYKNICGEIENLTVFADPYSQVRYIQPEHLEQALGTIIQDRKEMDSGHEPLTEEEWREFNAIWNKIIDVRLQCAHKIPITVGVSGSTSLTGPNLGANASISRSPGLDLNEAIEILENELSDYQKQLYMRVMKRKYLIKRGFIDMAKKQLMENLGEWVTYTPHEEKNTKELIDETQENGSNAYVKYADRYLKPKFETNIESPKKSESEERKEHRRTAEEKNSCVIA